MIEYLIMASFVLRHSFVSYYYTTLFSSVIRSTVVSSHISKTNKNYQYLVDVPSNYINRLDDPVPRFVSSCLNQSICISTKNRFF